MNTLTDVDAAWLAGLFEGEGSLSINNPARHYWTLQIGMSDEDVVRKAYDITGVGSFISAYRPPSWKDHYKEVIKWSVNSQHDIFDVVTALYPYLGQRRRANADKFLEEFQTYFAHKKRRNWSRSG